MGKYKGSGYSQLKLFHHIDKVKTVLCGGRTAPIYVRLKPTNVCNQSCFYCGYADDLAIKGRRVDRRNSIPWSILSNTLTELSDIGVKAITFTGGGEPLCYSNIEDALSFVCNHGIDYAMITNGQLLQGDVVSYLENAKWIRVSLDASNEKTYEKVRYVDEFRSVVRNISKFCDKDTGCVLGINCVVSKYNSDEVYDVIKLAKDIGADNIKISPYYTMNDVMEYHSFIREGVINQLKKAIQDFSDDSFEIIDQYTDFSSQADHALKTYDRCYIQEFFCVIAADSKVYRCHQRAYMEIGEIGDLYKNTFNEIWFNEDTIQNVREFNPIDKCKLNCNFHNRNEMLYEFYNMDNQHINFI